MFGLLICLQFISHGNNSIVLCIQSPPYFANTMQMSTRTTIQLERIIRKCITLQISPYYCRLRFFFVVSQTSQFVSSLQFQNRRHILIYKQNGDLSYVTPIIVLLSQTSQLNLRRLFLHNIKSNQMCFYTTYLNLIQASLQ